MPEGKQKNRIAEYLRELGLRPFPVLVLLLGSAVQAFALYNVHAVSAITEGGVLGFTLLLYRHLGISPAVSGFILNAALYIFGWRVLGRRFVALSFVSNVGYAVAYGILENFTKPLWPDIGSYPLLAAAAGAIIIGSGAGLCVLMGGATSGDDALAMGLKRLTGVPVQRVYLISDMVVLLLSLSYIPFKRIIYSLMTVILSGQIIGLFQKLPLPGREEYKKP